MVGQTVTIDFPYYFVRESEVLGRLLDVYLSQAHYYWQEPDLLAWLESNVEAVLQLVEPAQFNNEHHGSTHAHPRHPDPRLAEYSEKFVLHVALLAKHSTPPHTTRIKYSLMFTTRLNVAWSRARRFDPNQKSINICSRVQCCSSNVEVVLKQRSSEYKTYETSYFQ